MRLFKGLIATALAFAFALAGCAHTPVEPRTITVSQKKYVDAYSVTINVKAGDVNIPITTDYPESWQLKLTYQDTGESVWVGVEHAVYDTTAIDTTGCYDADEKEKGNLSLGAPCG